LKGQTKEVYGLQVISPQVLRVKFLRPQSYFISSLTHPAFWVYDSQDKTALAPGTGAFRIKNLAADSVQVEAFAQYHGDIAQISGIEFQVFADESKALAAYREGKINLMDEVQPAQVKELANDERIAKQFIRQPLFAVYGIAFNLDKEPWRDNYLLRRALNYAIDRPAIVRDIFANGALSCSGPLPSGLTLGKSATRGYNYNPEFAKQLLSDSGHPDGDGLPSITLYYLPNSGYKQLASSVAEQLNALGIEVYARPVNKKSLLSELNSRRFQTCLVGWHADYPEAYAFFGTIYNHGITGYQNGKVSKLLSDAGGLYKSTGKRQQTLLQAYKIITEDAPMLWLCQPQTVKLVSPLVSGIEVNGMNQINWGRVSFRSPQ
ncbi:MAG: ABC transporter substrate-binding protein, partial [Methanomassiliicoccales archaeon]